MAFKTDRRLWLTADRARVVEDGDPDARFLLASAGKTIPNDLAERYGLIVKETPKRAAKGKVAS